MAYDPHRYAVARVEAGDVASDGQLLYRWHGNHWSVLEEDQGEREAYHWLVTHDREYTSAENARRAHRATLLFAPPLPAPSEWLIPCRNGYVRLGPDGPERVPAEPVAGMRYVLGAEFRPEEGFGQRFLAFLERVLPDPAVRERVQEYTGYTLTADARHQRAQLWLGRGANGKGVLCNILQALHQRVAAVSLEALDGFRLSGLVGASLVVADEVPRGRLNEQLLKSLIAGERVLVDRKHRDPLSLSLQGKWLVLGNQLPKISDHSLGFWRRWDLVPFEVTIPEGERSPAVVKGQ